MTRRVSPPLGAAGLGLAAALAACAAVPGAGGEPVSADYREFLFAFGPELDGLTLAYAFRLKEVDGRAAVCGATGRAGGDPAYVAALMQEVRARSAVRHGGAVLVPDLTPFPESGATDLTGAEAACVLTATAWRAELADPAALSVDPPDRVLIRM